MKSKNVYGNFVIVKDYFETSQDISRRGSYAPPLKNGKKVSGRISHNYLLLKEEELIRRRRRRFDENFRLVFDVSAIRAKL